MGLFDGLPLDDGNSTLVATPNGPVRVPNQIASAFGPGAIAPPVPQGPASGATGVAPGIAPEVAGAPGAPVMPPEQPAGPMPVAAPIAPGLGPLPLPEIPIAGIKVPPPVRAPKPGPMVTPPAPDPFAAAQADHADATALGLQGIADKATAEAKQGDAEAAVIAATNLKTDKATAELAAFNKQQAAAQQQHIAGIDAATDAYAKSVVDPSRYWHNLSTGDKVLSGIAIALGAIGQGLTRGQDKNFGLDMVQKAIEQDVQQQMADRDKLKTVVGMKGQALEQLMMVTKDRNATEQAAISAGYTRGAAEIQRIGAASKNPRVQADAKTLGAQMLQDAATLKDQASASSWKRKYDDAAQANQLRHERAEEGIAWAGHSETRREFDITDKFRNKQLDETLDEKAAEAASKGGAKLQAAQAAQQALGIRNAKGEAIYQPKGKAMLAAAAKLDAQNAPQIAKWEAAAAATKDPQLQKLAQAQAQILRDQADDLRGEALNNTVKASDKGESKPLNDELAATQTALEKIQELKDMLDDGDIDDLHNNAAASELWNSIAANMAVGMHARYGEKTMEQVAKMIGDDPTSLSRVWDRATFKTYGDRLGQAAKDLRQGTIQKVRRQTGFTGPDSEVLSDPSAPPPPELAAEKAVFADKTAEERAQASQPGILKKGLDYLAYPLGGSYSNRGKGDDIREHEAPLSPASALQIETFAKGAAKGNENAKIALRGILGSPKLGLASPAFGIVRGIDADLADQLASQLPAERRDELLTAPKLAPRTMFGGLTDDDFDALSAPEIAKLAARDPQAAQSLHQRLVSGKGLTQGQQQKTSDAFARYLALTATSKKAP